MNYAVVNCKSWRGSWYLLINIDQVDLSPEVAYGCCYSVVLLDFDPPGRRPNSRPLTSLRSLRNKIQKSQGSQGTCCRSCAWHEPGKPWPKWDMGSAKQLSSQLIQLTKNLASREEMQRSELLWITLFVGAFFSQGHYHLEVHLDDFVNCISVSKPKVPKGRPHDDQCTIPRETLTVSEPKVSQAHCLMNAKPLEVPSGRRLISTCSTWRMDSDRPKCKRCGESSLTQLTSVNIS